MSNSLSQKDLEGIVDSIQNNLTLDEGIEAVRKVAIAHADMVIGKDEDEHPYGDARKMMQPTMRNRLRAEQRERNK